MNAEAYLLRRGRDAVPRFLAYLDHPDPQVRALSAHALGEVPDLRAVDPLIARLDEEAEERTVRQASALALGRIADYRAGPSLMRALDSDYPFLRFFAALSLGRITGQSIAVDRPAWEAWWNRQPALKPIPARQRPEGSVFLLRPDELAEEHFFKAVRGTAQDNIPAILKPVWTDKDDRTLKTLLDHASLVFGIPGPGRPLSFSQKLMDYHQVVNFSLSGRPAVLMSCPLGGYATAFYTDSPDGTYTFGVSGYLHNAAMVPYDHQTESFWNPVDGTAALGPLKGRKLERIPLVLCTWKVWKQRYPDALALAAESYRDGLMSDGYLMPLYPGYLQSDRLLAPLGRPESSDGVPLKERVVGIHLGQACRAYPVSELEKAGGLIEDKLSGCTLRLQWNREQKLMIARSGSGELLPITPAFWFAWHAYHPETEVFRFKE